MTVNCPVLRAAAVAMPHVGGDGNMEKQIFPIANPSAAQQLVNGIGSKQTK